jgi:hypothetical protein
MTQIITVPVGKKTFQMQVFNKNEIDSFDINQLYLHCVKKTLYDIRRLHSCVLQNKGEEEGQDTICPENCSSTICPENCLVIEKRFWFETDILDLKYGYSENIYKENSDEGSIIVSLDNTLLNLITSIESKVVDIFEQQYANQIIGSTILTFESIKKMFKSGIIPGYENYNSMKFNVHKKHCCVFLNNELVPDDFNFNSITLRYTNYFF